MERLIKSKPLASNFEQIVSPGVMRFLDFARLELPKGESYKGRTADRELIIDFFAGDATVSVETSSGKTFDFLAQADRQDVFGGPPAMLYVPPKTEYQLTATNSKLETGLFSAPASIDTDPVLVPTKETTAKKVGQENWQRTVFTSLDNNITAERLLAGETLTPPGNWSSYPPHKHDRNNPPHEAPLEEIYFFRTKPAGGCGMIWTYTDPSDTEGFNNVFIVEDGDTVLLPKGYHPVVAAPGYELHYTWILAGEERRYGAWFEDPRHSWVSKAQ